MSQSRERSLERRPYITHVLLLLLLLLPPLLVLLQGQAAQRA